MEMFIFVVDNAYKYISDNYEYQYKEMFDDC